MASQRHITIFLAVTTIGLIASSTSATPDPKLVYLENIGSGKVLRRDGGNDNINVVLANKVADDTRALWCIKTSKKGGFLITFTDTNGDKGILATAKIPFSGEKLRVEKRYTDRGVNDDPQIWRWVDGDKLETARSAGWKLVLDGIREVNTYSAIIADKKPDVPKEKCAQCWRMVVADELFACEFNE